MAQDNVLVHLISNGLSWKDHIAAEEQAQLLSTGQIEAWKEEIYSSSQTWGIPRVLKQIALSFENTKAWGMYVRSVLGLFGILELQGLSCDPAELVKRVAKEEPSSWDDANKIASRIAKEYLEKQIAAGDVHLLQPSRIESTAFLVFVPSIIEARSRHPANPLPYLLDDDLVDMFDFLRLPIALELMLESGIGGRAPLIKATEVLKKLKELELTSEVKPRRRRNVETRPEDCYSDLYVDCAGAHAELLRGVVMSYDPDDAICKKGLELIVHIGHPLSRAAFLQGLGRTDDDIVELALRGLGMVGIPDDISKIVDILDGKHADMVQAVACTTLGRLDAREYSDKIAEHVRSSDEVALAAMTALLTINTPESLNHFWRNLRRLGYAKLAPVAKFVAGTENDLAVLFLMDVLLLDMQAFVNSGEIPFLNAFMQAKKEEERSLLNVLVGRMRDNAATGFGKLGDSAVPILVTVLQAFPQTRDVFRGMEVWTDNERQTSGLVSRRIAEYHRLPKTEVITPPVDEAIKALGMTHSKRAVPFLAKLCTLHDERIVARAMEALSEIDLPALDELLTIRVSSKELRTQLIHDVGTIVHPKATDWLIKQLEDKEPSIRMLSAGLLSMRNDPELSKYLMRVAKDKNVAVRAGLANAIVRLGMNAYPEVMDILSKDKDRSVRQVIEQARIHFKTNEEGDFWA